jgi:hypothetical protein
MSYLFEAKDTNSHVSDHRPQETTTRLGFRTHPLQSSSQVITATSPDPNGGLIVFLLQTEANGRVTQHELRLIRSVVVREAPPPLRFICGSTSGGQQTQG